jgi:DNA-directed RNA polymerase subunit RPC12/RpoP
VKDTYRCKQCGYTSETGAGYLPPTCPQCGSTELSLKKARAAPAEPAPPAPPSAEEEEKV